jgi:hypothetical protein
MAAGTVGYWNRWSQTLLSDAYTNTRARANRALYLAKIVLAAWRRDLDRREIPASTLAQAFQGAAREHLVAAYGWFLLAVCQAGTPPQGPPRGCRELPAMPAGKVYPAEINEFRQLESGGWLGDMLRDSPDDIPASRQQGNLAFAAGNLPAAEQVEGWLRQLETLIERMGDSLDEC